MKTSVPAICGLFVLVASTALAADPPSTPAPADITKVTCKEVMSGNDQGRAVSVAFYQGYLLGKKGDTSIDVATASDTADAVQDYCLSNPASTLLDAFSKAPK